MRAKIIIAFTIAACACFPVSAQVNRFPYDAKVVVDEAYVRSGRGNNTQYYPTGRLLRGATVTVRRHEPGGWLMIDPPDGSFSWIPSKYVDRTDNVGTVREDNVVVFVGSEFGDESGVWQRSLRAGDQVAVLGEQTIDTQSGRQAMYRIAPPPREYRWIPGAAVIPVDAAVREQVDNDPYAMPSQARRTTAETATTVKDSGDAAAAGVVETPPVVVSTQLKRLQQIRAEQQQLAEIDLRFRQTVLKEPSEWDLQSIETEYRELQERATWKPVAGQIDLRYPAIERYRRRKAEFEDFRRLTSQTEARDAELIGAHRTALAPMLSADFGDPLTPTADPGPQFAMSPGIPPGIPQNLARLFAGNEFSGIPSSDVTVPPAAESAAADSGGQFLDLETARSRYIGAGIIARPAGDPASAEFVLTTPSGRVLAHLQPDEGVDLESYVGKEVGLHGSRWYKDEIQSDYIEVSGLESVRIRR